MRAAAQDGRGEERECVDAEAIATVSATFCFQHSCEISPELPEDLMPIDFDELLYRVRALASQF